MGVLVEGEWADRGYETEKTGGAFVRMKSGFRDIVTADGSSGFHAEPGRYHLYVSFACPWAHRTLIFRKLKRLEAVIGMTAVEPLMLEQGWTFGGAGEPLYGKRRLYEIYTLAAPRYSGRVTVPVLWDKVRRTIVNNESAEIIRMLNGAFDRWAAPGDYYPEPLRTEIDRVNARVYDEVNNGVYKAGFATKQGVYESAFEALFTALDWLEERLEAGDGWLVGGRLTEADIRLFTTLIRFDAVYYGHFKCNRRHVYEYRNLWELVRRIRALPGVAETIDLAQIKQHYYGSHRHLNPTGIVPVGPTLPFD
jgi:putative glutathione S-transferase